MIKKKFFGLLVLLVFALLLAACGAPPEDTPPEVIEVTVVVHSDPQIVEVEKIVEVTAAPPEPAAASDCAPGWDENFALLDDAECPENWGILYLEVTQHTVLWQLVGETEDEDLLFQRFAPLIHYAAGKIVLTYNGLGSEEYYLNDDGDLAVAGPDWPNGQDLYFDKDGNSVATFLGRWVGLWIDADGHQRADERYFYKVAGPEGPGLYILADHVLIPLCENLILAVPQSCNQ